MPKINRFQQRKDEYLRLDQRDRRRFWADGIMNNALYILMAIFVVYTAIKNKNFVSPGSIANIVSLVAASLPMALGIAGCIVLTGTDLSGGRVVGLTAAVAGALLQDRIRGIRHRRQGLQGTDDQHCKQKPRRRVLPDLLR